MDIMTHTLSGIAISTIVASVSKKEMWKKGLIIVCGATGGALPDIDAVSLWSRFDNTIGAFFHLAQNGRDIYFGNHWYSHHNFTHSFVGGLIITSFIVMLFSFPAVIVSKDHARTNIFKCIFVYWVAMFLGYSMHLMGDLPTPGHTWGGIKLFWPLHKAVGGSGRIWWWNNYDIFLIIVGCCAINMGIIILNQIIKKPFIRYFPAVICIISIAAILHQIDQRTVNFSYSGYTKRFDEYEKRSLEIQQEILGNKLYAVMRAFDRKMVVYF